VTCGRGFCERRRRSPKKGFFNFLGIFIHRCITEGDLGKKLPESDKEDEENEKENGRGEKENGGTSEESENESEGPTIRGGKGRKVGGNGKLNRGA
jgi:hypothetical protein